MRQDGDAFEKLRGAGFVVPGLALIGTCVLLVCTACSGFFVDPTLSSIAVTPAGATILVNATQKYQAVGTYNDGSTKVVSPVWSSSAPTAATISTAGLAKGAGAGTTTITATAGGVTGTTTLTVQTAALTSIAVAPMNPSLSLTGTVQTQQFTATGAYADGTTQPITTAVTWASGTTATATIGASTGVATAVATGSTAISAASGSITGSTTLTVVK